MGAASSRPLGGDLDLGLINVSSRRPVLAWAPGTDPTLRLNDLFTLAVVPVLAVHAGLGAGLSPPRWLVVLAVVAIQVCALCWYRSVPVAALTVVAAAEVVGNHLGIGSPFVAVCVACYGAAAWASRPHRMLATAVALVPLADLWLVEYLAGRIPVGDTLLVLVCMIGFWLTGRYEAGQRHRIIALSAHSTRLEQERAVVEERAAERERALLARELHDILNHSVTAMVLDAQASAEADSDAEARATLLRVANTGRDTLAELRRLLGVLRAGPEPQAVDDAAPIAPPPTLDELEALIAGLPDGGPRIDLERVGTVRPVDTSIELAGYRVVQESLTNIVRHAGAVRGTVRLTYLPHAVEITVHNEPGPPRRRGDDAGTGLVGMHERVALLGGELRAGPDKHGFTVHAMLPLRGQR